MVDGPNTYGFCGGDPVNRSDPMGLDYEVWVLGVPVGKSFKTRGGADAYSRWVQDFYSEHAPHLANHVSVYDVGNSLSSHYSPVLSVGRQQTSENTPSSGLGIESVQAGVHEQGGVMSESMLVAGNVVVSAPVVAFAAVVAAPFVAQAGAYGSQMAGNAVLAIEEEVALFNYSMVNIFGVNGTVFGYLGMEYAYGFSPAGIAPGGGSSVQMREQQAEVRTAEAGELAARGELLGVREELAAERLSAREQAAASKTLNMAGKPGLSVGPSGHHVPAVRKALDRIFEVGRADKIRPTVFSRGSDAANDHWRMHNAEREYIGPRQGAFSGSNQELFDAYRASYRGLKDIRVDVRSPDGTHNLAENVTPEEAVTVIENWLKASDLW